MQHWKRMKSCKHTDVFLRQCRCRSRDSRDGRLLCECGCLVHGGRGDDDLLQRSRGCLPRYAGCDLIGFARQSEPLSGVQTLECESTGSWIPDPAFRGAIDLPHPLLLLWSRQ